MATNQSGSAIEWSPVIAGAILACAVSVVLTQFGHALGLSFTSLKTATTITPQSVLAFGLWVLWTQLSASIMGGYLAGRVTGPWNGAHESELRDGAHGLLSWALATLMTTIALGAVAAFSALAVNHGVEPQSDLSPEMLKHIGIISGFSLAAISIVSAAAAWIMGTIGGDHRDRKVDVRHHVSFRPRSAKR